MALSQCPAFGEISMNFRALLIIPPVVLGVLGYLWMTSGSEMPAAQSGGERAVAVRTVALVPRPITARAVGYGRVRAERHWSAVSELGGRLSVLAEEIAEGGIVTEGQLLAELDRTEYELARKKALANIAAAEAQAAELERAEDNARRALTVQMSILEEVRVEFERTESLVSGGTSTEAALTTARKALLAQEASVLDLTNNLLLYPEQRISADAALDVRRAELAEAERALERTTIIAPFRGRVTSVNTEQNQFVRTGDVLFAVESSDFFEVTAEVQPRALSPLFAVVLRSQAEIASHVDYSEVVSLLQQAGITATVSLPRTGSSAMWPAEIVRLRGTTDDETGALGLVVRVANPLIAEPTERRPPLRVGTFVAVTFEVAPGEDVIAVPRAALRYSDRNEPLVYLSDAENRLQIRAVELGPVVGSDVVIRSGLEEGEVLVLSEPRPPVPGLKLEPVEGGRAAAGR